MDLVLQTSETTEFWPLEMQEEMSTRNSMRLNLQSRGSFQNLAEDVILLDPNYWHHIIVNKTKTFF